jgi:hypothetical protein
MTRFTRLGYFALGVLLVAVTAAPAGERPHKLRGTGRFVTATDFVGEGHATHLGDFDEVGGVQFSPTDDPAVLRIDGWAIHTAANGDEVHEVLTGRVNLQTGIGIATATYVGGTGRFADATGSAAITFQLLADGSYEFAGEGTIDY